jgi:hypothetical protein
MSETLMGEIEFTQYLMPNGRKRPNAFPAPMEIVEKAWDIQMRGYRFEVELLSDYHTVSLTISDGEQDVACELTSNDPELPKAVERLINNFHKRLSEDLVSEG